MRLILPLLLLSACGGSAFDSKAIPFEGIHTLLDSGGEKSPEDDGTGGGGSNADGGAGEASSHFDGRPPEIDSGASLADGSGLDSSAPANDASGCTPFTYTTSAPVCSGRYLGAPGQFLTSWSSDGGDFCEFMQTPAACQCLETYSCACILAAADWGAGKNMCGIEADWSHVTCSVSGDAVLVSCSP